MIYVSNAEVAETIQLVEMKLTGGFKRIGREWMAKDNREIEWFLYRPHTVPWLTNQILSLKSGKPNHQQISSRVWGG